MRTYKVGDRILVVEPEENGLCFDCYFFSMDKGCQKRMEYRLPHCENDFKLPIIFKEIKTADYEPK
jgi:hypothetical protein